MPTLLDLQNYISSISTYFGFSRRVCPVQAGDFLISFSDSKKKMDAHTLAQEFVLKFSTKQSLRGGEWKDASLSVPNLISDILDLCKETNSKKFSVCSWCSHGFVMEALVVLSIFSRNDANKDTIREKGGVEILLNCIKSHLKHPAMLYCLCRALRNLAMCEKIEEMLGEKGIIPLILQVLRDNPDHAPLQEQASWVLTNISCDPNNKELIRENEGLEVMVGVMERHIDNPKIQEAITWAIANATCKSDENIFLIGGSECISLLLTGLEKHTFNEEYLRGALRTLENIATLDSNAEKIGERGGVQTLLNIATQTTGKPIIQKHILRTLADFVWSPKNFSDFCSHDGVKYVVSTMRNYQNSTEIQEAASILFYDCLNCADEIFHVQLETFDVIDMLCTLSRTYRGKIENKQQFKILSLSLKSICRKDERHLKRYQRILSNILDSEHHIFRQIPRDLTVLVSSFLPAYPLTH